MSDALSRREIEDVLTSIRRLVSKESARPPQGKLVLTPAFRVAAGGAPAAHRGVGAGDRTAANSPYAATASLAVADRAGSPDGERPDHAGVNGATLARLPELPDRSLAPAGAGPRDALEALVRQIVASESGQTGPAAPAGQDEPTAPKPVASTATRSGAALSLNAMAAPAAAPLDALEEHLAALEASIRQSEQAISGGKLTATHTVAVAAPQAAQSAVGPGTAAPQLRDTGAPASGGFDQLPDPDGADTEVVDIDEDGLRALVAEILREELQGALGERITRNIRKLVRTEVARALASQPPVSHSRSGHGTD